MNIKNKIPETCIFSSFIINEFLDDPFSVKKIKGYSKKRVRNLLRIKDYKKLKKFFNLLRPKMYEITFTRIKEWREAEITKKELGELKVINVPEWRNFFYNNRRGNMGQLVNKIRNKKIIFNKRIKKILKISRNAEELKKMLSGEKRIIILKNSKGFYSVLEGDHRVPALLLSGIKFKILPVYLGIKKPKEKF